MMEVTLSPMKTGASASWGRPTLHPSGQRKDHQDQEKGAESLCGHGKRKADDGRPIRVSIIFAEHSCCFHGGYCSPDNMVAEFKGGDGW